MLYDGAEFGGFAVPGSDEELDFIGLPGILEPDQVRELLLQRQQRQARAATRRAPAAAGGGTRPRRCTARSRSSGSCSTAWSGLYAKNTGEPHGLVHAELRRVCGGPAVAQASVTQLQARIDFLRKRLGAH